MQDSLANTSFHFTFGNIIFTQVYSGCQWIHLGSSLKMAGYLWMNVGHYGKIAGIINILTYTRVQPLFLLLGLRNLTIAQENRRNNIRFSFIYVKNPRFFGQISEKRQISSSFHQHFNLSFHEKQKKSVNFLAKIEESW